MLFAYFAPEVVLPVASVVAATIGFFMLIGRNSIRFVVHAFRRVVEKMKL